MKHWIISRLRGSAADKGLSARNSERWQCNDGVTAKHYAPIMRYYVTIYAITTVCLFVLLTFPRDMACSSFSPAHAEPVLHSGDKTAPAEPFLLLRLFYNYQDSFSCWLNFPRVLEHLSEKINIMKWFRNKCNRYFRTLPLLKSSEGDFRERSTLYISCSRRSRGACTLSKRCHKLTWRVVKPRARARNGRTVINVYRSWEVAKGAWFRRGKMKSTSPPEPNELSKLINCGVPHSFLS